MSRSNKTTMTTKALSNEPGGRANVFSFYVIIITLTLHFRLRYVTVGGVKRIAARV